MGEHGINAQMASWYVRGIYQTGRAEGGPHVTTKVVYICRALADHSYHVRVLWDTCEGIYKRRSSERNPFESSSPVRPNPFDQWRKESAKRETNMTHLCTPKNP